APRIARPSFPLAATGRCYRKHGQSPLQRTAVTFRVEPARAELAAQPGELALGELAGGEDRAVAEPGRGGRPVQVFPGLAVAHGADRRQLQWRRMPGELGQRAQGADLVEEALRQHGVE